MCPMHRGWLNTCSIRNVCSELPLRVTIREPEKVEGQNSLGIKTHFVQVGRVTFRSL